METQGTVEKAMDVLFHLHTASGPQGVTAVGRALGLPKSSAHRLLTSLGRRGLVERDDRGRYQPGMALVALGLGVLEAQPIVVAARPELESGAREIGETFYLVAARGGELTVLAKAEGTGFLRASPRVGSRVPIHGTAAGKLWLAFAREALAPLSVNPAEELEGEIEETRSEGYAVNRDSWVEGLSAVAAPIFAFDRLEAVVAAAVPTSRFAEIGVDRLAARTRDAAERIAACIEGRSPAQASTLPTSPPSSGANS
jgi:IclR family acetate operon transcriptional repressor